MTEATNVSRPIGEERPPKQLPFKIDHRQENPSLHLLYVKGAIRNLMCIRKSQLHFQQLPANVPLMPLMAKIQEEVDNLINEDAAYYEANEILAHCVIPYILESENVD